MQTWTDEQLHAHFAQWDASPHTAQPTLVITPPPSQRGFDYTLECSDFTTDVRLTAVQMMQFLQWRNTRKEEGDR